MNFAARLLAQIEKPVEALTREQFSKWDHARQQQYLRDHPKSDFHNPEGGEEKPSAQQDDSPSSAKPPAESKEVDNQYPVPEAPTTYMVLNKVLGPLDKAQAELIRNYVDQILGKEAVGVAEINLRSLTRGQLKYVMEGIRTSRKAVPELEPETQTVLNTLIQALTNNDKETP